MDPDNGPVTWSWVGTAPTSFSISATTGEIATTTPLDFEQQSYYSLPVRATDADGEWSETSVIVTVMDVDEQPHFNSPASTSWHWDDDHEQWAEYSNYPATISEGALSGTVVCDLDATGYNGAALTYRLVGTAPAPFQISSQTGAISTSGPIDFESASSYALVVEVADAAGRWARANVAVSVVDVDEFPRFTNADTTTPVWDPVLQRSVDEFGYQRMVGENLSAGTLVVNLSATGYAGAAVTYHLVGSSPSNSFFTVDAATGAVRTVSPLDHELAQTHSLTIEARDAAGNASRAMLQVTVVDAPGVTVSATAASMAEPSDPYGPGGSSAFRITRTGNLSSEVTVYFTLSGATPGIDYQTMSVGWITMASGQMSADVDVWTMFDGAAEGNETLQLTITPNDNYELPPNGASAQIAILDTGSSGGGGGGGGVGVTAVVNGPWTVTEGTMTTVSAGGSSSSSGAPLTYAWDFDDDGFFDDSYEVAPSISAGWLASAGALDGTPFNLTVQVSDGYSTSTASASITVQNASPAISNLGTGAGPYYRGDSWSDEVYLTAQVSDPGADTLTGSVAWGDGTTSPATITAGTMTASHSYEQAGQYTIHLTVTDSNGAATTSQTTVDVVQITATISGEQTVYEGEMFDLNLSTNAPGDTWLIDWEAATFDQFVVDDALSISVQSTSHVYDRSGTFTVLAYVHRNDGLIKANPLTITVVNLPPEFDTDPLSSPINEGNYAHISGFVSDVMSDTVTVSVYWDGEENAPETMVLNPGGGGFLMSRYFEDDDPTATDEDTKLVVVKLTDSDGASVSRTVPVTVRNVAPTILTLHAEQTASDGSIRLTGDFTDPAIDADTFTVLVTWGEDDTETLEVEPGEDSFETTKTFTESGDYVVVVTVLDDDAGESQQRL